MRKIIIALSFISQISYGADFTVQFEPANNSIDDSKISSISSSKISDLNTSLAAYLLKTEIKAPTIQKFLSGSGTYSTPIGVRYIKVKMAGGGGAGCSNEASGGTGHTAGGASTFGSILTANGGGIGALYSNGGIGGTASISLPATGLTIQGGHGGPTSVGSSSPQMGSFGGSNPLGGAGSGGNHGNNPGLAAMNNTGGGGGAAATAQGGYSGNGGGAGGYLEATISSPNATYSYSVGNGGTPSGTVPGGAGGSGLIIVEEFYQ